MDRLLVKGDPVGPFQYLYVFKNDKMIESMGVSYNDLADTAFLLLKKYNLTHIDLSGSRFYTEGIEKAIKEYSVIDYNKDDLTFRYV